MQSCQISAALCVMSICYAASLYLFLQNELYAHIVKFSLIFDLSLKMIIL
jgi:hypothetical protein